MKRVTQLMLIGLISFFTFNAEAEEEQLSVTSSDFLLEGSANIGDWNCSQEAAEGTMKVTHGEDGKQIQSLEVSIPVEEFSNCEPPRGSASSMESSLHDYLEAEDHPYITFDLNRIHPDNLQDQNEFYGDLTVAGVSKTIRATVTPNSQNGNITLSGAQDLNMTDFEIDPPTALLGAVRAREDVKVDFELTFE